MPSSGFAPEEALRRATGCGHVPALLDFDAGLRATTWASAATTATEKSLQTTNSQGETSTQRAGAETRFHLRAMWSLPGDVLVMAFETLPENIAGRHALGPDAPPTRRSS
jgi:hypothetical protein